jgi:CMP-N-acetylneuraminic acid synthetase
MILAVIPARMGSQRIPRKNLAQIRPGQTLVDQAIQCAWRCGLVDQVVVSTDEPEAFEDCGAIVLRRPAAICGPSADIGDAARHALAACGDGVTHVLTLQPAVLARSPTILRALITAVRDIDAGGGLTMAHTVPWHWRTSEGVADCPWMGPGRRYPRSQDSPQCFAEVNGAQICRADDLRRGGRWSLPLVIAELPSWAVALDIDTPHDLATAQHLWPTLEPLLATWDPPIHQVDYIPEGAACTV